MLAEFLPEKTTTLDDIAVLSKQAKAVKTKVKRVRKPRKPLTKEQVQNKFELKGKKLGFNPCGCNYYTCGVAELNNYGRRDEWKKFYAEYQQAYAKAQ